MNEKDLPKLTKKQQRFVEEYLISLNGTKAAINAGFSEKTAAEQASRLLRNVNVAAHIDYSQKQIQEKNWLTVDYVINNLRQVCERCMQAEPVYDNEGNETGVYRFEAHAANRSLELLGKHIGMFSDKLQLTGKDGGPIKVINSTMTEQEAAQIYFENLKLKQ